jgi:hypothetical protein
MEGDLEAVRMFIEEGFAPIRCHISGSNAWGTCETPIETAVRSKKYEVVGLVLKLGADPNGDCISPRVPYPTQQQTHHQASVTAWRLPWTHCGSVERAGTIFQGRKGRHKRHNGCSREEGELLRPSERAID